MKKFYLNSELSNTLVYLCPQLLISCYPKICFFLLTWQTWPFINICTFLLYLLGAMEEGSACFHFILKNVMWTNYASWWWSFFKCIQSLISRKWHTFLVSHDLSFKQTPSKDCSRPAIRAYGVMRVGERGEECWPSWKITQILDGTEHPGMLLSS